MMERTTKYNEGCELVRRWRASGKNQSEFCRAVGIAPQRLHYWRQRVREEDLEPPKAAPSFVAVQVRPPAPGAGVEVVLGNGRIVRVRGAVDGELLRQVLAAAEGAC